MIPVRHIHEFTQSLESEGFLVKDIPEEVFKVMALVHEFPIVDMTRIPEDLFNALLPFQKRGVLFSIQHDGKVFICDEMGLGKTIQAISIAAYYRDEWPVLVIVPSFLKEQWSSEFKRWFPDMYSEINIITTSKNWNIGLINIVSYELIHSLKDSLFQKHNFDVIICDESHYLKSLDSLRSLAVVPLLKKAKRRILLTGTPALSRPCELYPQMDALGIPIFSKFKDFGLRYCKAFQGPHGWDYSGSSNLHELHAILRKTIMIRRMKNDVLTELPAKNRSLVYIEPKEEIVKEIQANLGKVGEKKNWKKDMKEDSTMTMLFQKTSSAKLDATETYLSNLLENEDRKMLIFAYHLEMMDRISELLTEQDVPFIRIDGNTPVKTRSTLTDQFSKQPRFRVAILSVTCASSGINMVAASLVIFTELYWTPGVLLQAEDRTHRIGQKASHIDIHYLIARGTLDDIMWPLIEKKMKVVGETLNGQKEYLDAIRVEGSSFRTIESYFLDICESESPNTDVKPKKRTKNQSSESKRRKSLPENGQTITAMFKEIEERSKHMKPILIDLCDDDSSEAVENPNDICKLQEHDFNQSLEMIFEEELEASNVAVKEAKQPVGVPVPVKEKKPPKRQHQMSIQYKSSESSSKSIRDANMLQTEDDIESDELVHQVPKSPSSKFLNKPIKTSRAPRSTSNQKEAKQSPFPFKLESSRKGRFGTLQIVMGVPDKPSQK